MLEYTVRPFQSPAPHGSGRIPSTPRDTREKATLTWGAKSTVSGDIKGRGGINVVCCREEAGEIDREMEPRQVNSGIDPRHYFQVSRATKIKFSKTDSNDCIKGWEQMSGVAAAVEDWMAEFTDDLHAGRGDDKVACEHVYHLRGNTRGGGLALNTHDYLGYLDEPPYYVTNY